MGHLAKARDSQSSRGLPQGVTEGTARDPEDNQFEEKLSGQGQLHFWLLTFITLTAQQNYEISSLTYSWCHIPDPWIDFD